MEQEDSFFLATSDETLWKGYAEWLDEQGALATFERLHEEGILIFSLDFDCGLSQNVVRVEVRASGELSQK